MTATRFDKPDAPITSILSFAPLIRHAEKLSTPGDALCRGLSPGLIAMLRDVPEFMEPITDHAWLARHPRLMEALMELVFPPLYREREIACAMMPFADRPFFATPLFETLFLDDQGRLRGELTMDPGQLEQGRRIATYLCILEKYYGIHEELRFPIVRRITDPESGLERYYDIQLDFRFLDVKAHQPPAPPSPEALSSIRRSLNDARRLMALVPPENFELHGFIVHSAVDVTAASIVSELERDLIDRLALISDEGFGRIQHLLRSLFRKKDLIAGISGLRDDQVLLINTGSTMIDHCIFQSSRHIPAVEFAGTPWEAAVCERRILLVRDVAESFNERPDGRKLFAPESRSMMIAPLIYQDTVIGTLAVNDPAVDAFSAMDTFQMAQLQPLFAVAIKKALSDFELQVQSIIKEKCTAIHPSVEWRFRKAAYRHLDRVHRGLDTEIEPIVFKDVYALFGVSDIRGSTDQRNQATQKDLEDHLALAQAVIRAAARTGKLMILEELAERIALQIEGIREGLSSNDETRVADLIQREVEPLFPHLETLGDEVAAAIGRYRDALDPATGELYRRRKAFDDSVTQLNNRLAGYLDAENAGMQAVFAHYFEKHRTDGVDYLVYVGQSLMEKGRFSDLYLKDLRLWQIRLAAGMAWHTHQLKPTLPVPLDTAHLILIQNTPTAIRFRYDEKRFDVDGAYDVRYEIIKSRLDKARVKGTNQRLTQPGQIAVVFSHTEEGAEIRRYIDFFSAQGILTGETEELEIEDLPGVHGLRALRTTVNLERPPD
jgi:hypothetical protein